MACAITYKYNGVNRTYRPEDIFGPESAGTFTIVPGVAKDFMQKSIGTAKTLISRKFDIPKEELHIHLPDFENFLLHMTLKVLYNYHRGRRTEKDVNERLDELKYHYDRFYFSGIGKQHRDDQLASTRRKFAKRRKEQEGH